MDARMRTLRIGRALLVLTVVYIAFALLILGFGPRLLELRSSG